MPETSIFLDTVDERAVVSFILNRGGSFVGDRQAESRYHEIRSLDEYEIARRDERLFFVLFDCYATCPLVLKQTKGGYYDGSYYVAPRIGGPTIDFLACVQRTDGGQEIISDGFLGYYTSWEDPRTGNMLDTPELLIMQYKAIAREIKKDGKIIRASSGRKYVIAAHAYERVKRGELFLGVKGLEVS